MSRSAAPPSSGGYLSLPPLGGGFRAWTPATGGIRLAVRVTPRGGRDAVQGIGEDAEGAPHVKVRVAAAPVDGEANTAVEKLVAKWLGVPKSTVEVVGGLMGRQKVIMVEGDPVQLLHRCHALMAQAEKTMMAQKDEK
jgi:uncharacterized protein YggU (UPF0235/DUF167 family)